MKQFTLQCVDIDSVTDWCDNTFGSFMGVKGYYIRSVVHPNTALQELEVALMEGDASVSERALHKYIVHKAREVHMQLVNGTGPEPAGLVTAKIIIYKKANATMFALKYAEQIT